MALSKYREDDLVAAITAAVKGSKFFPRPAQIIDYMPNRESVARRLMLPEGEIPDPTDEERAEVRRLTNEFLVSRGRADLVSREKPLSGPLRDGGGGKGSPCPGGEKEREAAAEAASWGTRLRGEEESA